MSKIGIFYGSTTGNTKAIAEKIQETLGPGNAVVLDVASASADDMESYQCLILGTSTWGAGDLQDDWDAFVRQLEGVDFSKKKIALFGLGDQEMYSDTFVNGMGALYELSIEKGAEVAGRWPTDGYDFSESSAVKDGKFIGLALDEDNQPELTDKRITEWADQVKAEMG